MSILLSCTCGQKMKVREEDTGKRVRCPGCGEVVLARVPSKFPTDGPAEPTSKDNLEAADALVFRGVDALDSGDAAKALALFSEAIHRNPNSAAAHTGRGQARFLKNDYDGALADF